VRQSRAVTDPRPLDVEEALDLRVDPVNQADAYRSMLLGVLGDRDPARTQAEFPGQLRAVVEEAGPHLRTRPGPGEWSVIELLGHFLDAEIVMAARYRWILTEDEPTLVGYDQDRWVQGLNHQEGDPADMLALFEALRASNLRLWAGTSEADRARVGLHTERGPESLELTFRLTAGHGLFHLGQMRRTIAAATKG
jgi:DinB superfamily